MGRFFALCLSALLLGACMAQPDRLHDGEDALHLNSALPDEVVEVGTPVFDPGEGLSPEETVAAYIDQQYRAYLNCSYIDISPLLDLEERSNRNALSWLELLVTRRRLLKENGLCYVETERFPYEIEYITEEDLRDERMEFWARRGSQA